MYDISEELTDMFPSLMVAEFRERLSVIKRAAYQFDMERYTMWNLHNCLRLKYERRMRLCRMQMVGGGDFSNLKDMLLVTGHMLA